MPRAHLSRYTRVSFPVSTPSGVQLRGLMSTPTWEELPTPPSQFRRETVALLLHPHPKLGGCVENNVVMALSDGLGKAGWASLALNTRGVGGSTGACTWLGTDEREDVTSAVEGLVSAGAKNVVIVGYSFGSCVGGSVVHDIPEVVAFAAISYPSGLMSNTLLGHHFPFIQKCTKPKLWITGDTDQFHSVSQWEERYKTLADPKQKVVVVDADHFWGGREKAVVQAVVEFLETLDINGVGQIAR